MTDGKYSDSIVVIIDVDPTGINPTIKSIKTFTSQNYPNPFTKSTIINYGLNKDSRVLIQIFNMNGKVIETLTNDMKKSGNYEVHFNASNLSTGTYFYNVKIGNDFNKINKMTVIK